MRRDREGLRAHYDLGPLIRQASHLAERAMRRLGHVPPTLLAETATGFVAYSPTHLPDEQAKDSFANTSRLIALGYRAKAIALVLESWMTLAKPGQILDPGVPPSESPERQECVFILAEAAETHGGRILKIERDKQGAFIRLEEIPMPDGVTGEGRFSQIMPPRTPSEQDSKIARQLLSDLGVTPERCDFEPGRN
jgi:hypothetical protein